VGAGGGEVVVLGRDARQDEVVETGSAFRRMRGPLGSRE
jgi:hypothetical protein